MSNNSSASVDLVSDDFTLVGVDGTEYQVSRVILSQHSDHFRETIFAHPDNKENQQGRYVFSAEIDPKNHLQLIINFMETKVIEFSGESVLYILKIADYLQMTDLVSLAKRFVERVIKEKKDVFDIFKACCEIGNWTECRQKTLEIVLKSSRNEIKLWNMEGLDESSFIELISNPSVEPFKQLIMAAGYMEKNPQCSSMVQNVMLLVAKSPITLSDIKPVDIVHLPSKVIFTFLSSNNLNILSESDVCLFIEDLLSTIEKMKIDKTDNFCSKIWECCRFKYLLDERIQELINNETYSIPTSILTVHLLSKTGFSVPSSYRSAVCPVTSDVLKDRGIPFIIIEEVMIVKNFHDSDRRFPLVLSDFRIQSVNSDIFNLNWQDNHFNVFHGEATKKAGSFILKNCYWNKNEHLVLLMSLWDRLFEGKATFDVNEPRSLFLNNTCQNPSEYAAALNKSYSQVTPKSLMNKLLPIEIHGSYNGSRIVMKLREVGKLKPFPSSFGFGRCWNFTLYKWSDFEMFIQ